MTRRSIWVAILGGWIIAHGGWARADEPPPRLDLNELTWARCRGMLWEGLGSEEFWPTMHAAEALSLEGHGAVVRAILAAQLAKEADDQRRCGLAREIVRAGDLAQVQVLLDVLASPDPHGHVHACESLFKVWQVGDGALLRRALTRVEQPKLALMAAAALARWGHRDALALPRKLAGADDGEVARVAAWVLARTGDSSDLPALRSGASRAADPLTRAYFEHALAALGDDEGLQALIRNLYHADPAERVYAAEFAPDARALDARLELVRLLDDPALDVRIRAASALLQLSRPPPPRPEEEIRRDVFAATDRNPRYSEGSVVVLRDGRLLYAATEFEGGASDSATARVVAAESADGGRTWGPPRVLQENVGRQNVMSVTLRRLAGPARFDGPIGLF